MSLASSLVIAACTAAVTVWLALRRFHAERWWERKAEAYSRIVETLNTLVEYCSTMSAAELGATYSVERKQQLRDEYDRAYLELRKATGIGSYIISNKVADVLARLEARPRFDRDSKAAWLEIFDAEYEAYKNALSQIRSLAKRDLRVSNAFSGYKRLGIVLSGLWLVSVPIVYFGALAMDRSPVTSGLRVLYDWIPGTKAAAPGELGHDIGFIPDVPVPNVLALSLLCAVPVLTGWFVLFVLPSSVCWVRDGFRRDKADAA